MNAAKINNRKKKKIVTRERNSGKLKSVTELSLQLI